MRFSALLFLLTIPLLGHGMTMPNMVTVCSHETSKGPAVENALGFIVEPDGFLLTTYQVLIDAEGRLRPYITVDVPSIGSVFTARIVGVEPTLNFSVLKIEAPGEVFEPSLVDLSRDLQPGAKVYALKHTADSESKLVSGTLVSLNSVECYQQSLTNTLYTAKMTLGVDNLGSPILDDSGRIIALYTGYEPPHESENSDHVDDQSITHLLPIFLAFNIYDSLKERQSLASPWTGFSIRPLNSSELTQFPASNDRYDSGVALEYIWDSSPAEDMGLKVNDILLRLSQHPTPQPADFQKWLYRYGVGSTVELCFLRDGEVLLRTYTIEERPSWAIPE